VSVVVADTGPLHYLILIDEIELLPRLFARVLVPELVHQELRHERTPVPVHVRASAPPSWLRIAPTPPLETLPFPALDDGERAERLVETAALLSGRTLTVSGCPHLLANPIHGIAPADLNRTLFQRLGEQAVIFRLLPRTAE